MKKLKSLLIMMFTLSIMIAGMTVSVSADTTTDLKSMKVYAVDASGNKKEIKINFDSATYSYDLTVMSNTVSISVEAEPADSTSTWSIEKDGINTKMDFGKNLTVVDVKSTAGAVQKYTLNTTKLTAEEESTYVPEGTTDSDNETKATTKKKSSGKTVKIGKKTYTIAKSFDKNLIPEGFKKSSAKYDDEKYPCIKGEVKDITAFYMYNDDSEGFYIYDAEKNDFEKMYNIKIKSRMYTIVTPDKVDSCLKNYKKKSVTIIDQKVKAWALDEEKGMYLVYAMNWNGDTYLYCYDDEEKCFQRYNTDNDTNTQMEAANKAYDNLQSKYNKLVSKYNILLKIVGGLVIVIIILIFVIINVSLNKKEKRVKKSQEDNDSDDERYPWAEDEADDDILSSVDEDFDRTDSEKSELNIDSDSSELDESFYGGEIEAEDEVLIDITDDEHQNDTLNDITDVGHKDEIEKKTKEAQMEAEEDLKETLKSMLPDEEVEAEDDDEDFEFIDLN